jgi:hypothetical protein
VAAGGRAAQVTGPPHRANSASSAATASGVMAARPRAAGEEVLLRVTTSGSHIPPDGRT